MVVVHVIPQKLKRICYLEDNESELLFFFWQDLENCGTTDM